ncbi:PIN-like domain-containing protein [Micromonospora sp. NPDC048986]|uniref:PIN-like domain-containing protein n=1 Tax=Micromonospora sp. NPDC048986 TaxID=3155644 RepID=UPI00340CF914
MAGLFDGFEGYRVVTTAEKRQALTAALVAVDANVLLNLYRYNPRTTNDLLAVLDKLGDRLVVPHQAILEFHRNRLKAIGNPEQANNDARTALDKSQQAALRALDSWSKQVALDESQLQHLHADVGQIFDKLRTAVDGAAPDRVHPSTPTDEDPVLHRLTDLLDGKVLARPDDGRWSALIDEGKQRVADMVPPGYLDAEKSDQNPEGAAGDFLVYIQACEEAKTRQLDLVIVTNDEKEDWWWRRGGDLIGPRQEMTREFFDLTGHRLFLMRPSDLLDHSDALNVQVNPNSAKDAGTSRSDIDDVIDAGADDVGVGEWTAETVDDLLDRLRIEGRRDLAEVILEAARQGGTISRDAVYAICGYSNDRLLVGFTRPTARITASLQAEQRLPEAVTPMLTALYRGPGRLYAVRIPPEVTEILNPRSPRSDTEVEFEPAGKYRPLADYLSAIRADSTSMTFAEIEDILGDALAPSARKHLPYWYSSQNSLGKAITAAGFRPRGVRIDAETVDFHRRG